MKLCRYGKNGFEKPGMVDSEGRLDGQTLPPYGGQLSGHLSGEANETLAAFRDRVYSVTQLESYGKCPFQFFADKVLRLNVAEELEEGLTPMERGGLLHEILFEFYTERRNRHLPPMTQTTDDEFREAVEQLTKIAQRNIEEIKVSDVFWDVEKEIILGTANRKGVLQEFLEEERRRPVEAVPAYFEVAFGSPVEAKGRIDQMITSVEPVKAGNVRLRGKVDRVDVGKDFFAIIDYKSGATIAGRREIGLGVSLQLPLYLYAVEQILADHQKKHLTAAAGSYYILKSPVAEKLVIGNGEYDGKAFKKVSRKGQLLKDEAELKSIIAQAIAFVNEYVDTIAKGDFPVQPKLAGKVCAYCDFKTVCRIQVRRDIPPKDDS